MATSLRPPGRPRHNADEIKRHPLTIRTTKALKDRLVEAARHSGRSLAGEIEFRLNQSFVPDPLGRDPQQLLQTAVGQIRIAAIELINTAEAHGLVTDAEAARARREWQTCE
ncbi:MAG: hypothetical protein WA709_05730 [Stellaceae bacterium]